MLWNLAESSEIVLFCIVFYGRPSGWSDAIRVKHMSQISFKRALQIGHCTAKATTVCFEP